MNVHDLLRADGSAWRDSVDQLASQTAAETPLDSKAPTRSRGLLSKYAVPTMVAAVVAAGLVVVGLVALGHHSDRPEVATAPSTTAAYTSNPGRQGAPTTLPTRPAVTETAPRATGQDASIPSAKRLSWPVDAAAISVPWLYISTSTDGRTLTVQYIAAAGDCVAHRGFVVDETDASVELTVVDQRDTSKTACAADLIEQRATVTLNEPLSDRPLLHAPVASSWQDFHW